MKTRIIIALVAQVLLYLIFFRLLPYSSDKYHGCYIHQDIYRQYIEAVISDKFIDVKNHSHKTITYFGKSNTKGTMIFPGYLEDMYDSLNVGDSIIKMENSIYYRVKSKATGKDTVFIFETTCKDSLDVYPSLSKLIAAKKYKEAYKMADSLISVHKYDCRLYFEKGVIAGDLENFVDAVKFIKKADSLNCNPDECATMLKFYEPLMKSQMKQEQKKQSGEQSFPPG
jgi:hypothetical protein